ncbi:IclR family transcriptional regulator [Nakamurella lactea]|uniref:IclR family transcriptional regulator n=1 Tax=Nakamurella lactea TaxID=459515 RepID=UPI00048D888C|nr:IclR family transcriptional regulator [Nakamurella lactea]
MTASPSRSAAPAHEPSPAVGRALTVLETLVASQEGLTLTALAKKAGIPLATCASIVYTLEQRGYAARKIVGRSHFWRPTLGLYGLAVQLVRKVDLTSIAQTEMQQLALELGMPVHIGVLNGTSVVYVAKATHEGFIQFNTYLGKIAPFNLTALGRAITAHLSDEELQPLLGKLSAGAGPKARASDPESFLALLDEVRRRGYAVEIEEEQSDIGCAAAPFFDADGRAAGAVGITGFAKDFKGASLKRAVAGVTAISREVSARLGFHPDHG